MPKTETNYEYYKDEILRRCCDGACYNCLARGECASLCAERGIDPSKSTPPCLEAWINWAKKPYKRVD